MATREPIKPQGIQVSPFFSPGIKSGRLLFVSGQAAVGENGEVVGPGDTARQAEYPLARVKAIVEAAGATMDDVVSTNTYLTPDADYAAFNGARSRTFPVDPPASTTVVVHALLRPGLLVEIQAVAVIPEGV